MLPLLQLLVFRFEILDTWKRPFKKDLTINFAEMFLLVLKNFSLELTQILSMS